MQKEILLLVLINHSGVTSTDTVHKDCTAQTLMEPLWVVVLWFSWWGSCAQTKYHLVYSPHPKVWSPSSTESGLLNPVVSGLTGLHCFDG